MKPPSKILGMLKSYHLTKKQLAVIFWKSNLSWTLTLVSDTNIHLDHILYSAMGMSFNDRLNPYQRFHMSIESIRHQFKFSIWRYERYCPVIFKTWQSDTLMKFNIFQLNSFTFRPWNQIWIIIIKIWKKQCTSRNKRSYLSQHI